MAKQSVIKAQGKQEEVGTFMAIGLSSQLTITCAEALLFRKWLNGPLTEVVNKTPYFALIACI